MKRNHSRPDPAPTSKEYSENANELEATIKRIRRTESSLKDVMKDSEAEIRSSKRDLRDSQKLRELRERIRRSLEQMPESGF